MAEDVKGDWKRFCAAGSSHYKSKILEKRLGIKKETGWDKVLFTFQRDQTANS